MELKTLCGYTKEENSFEENGSTHVTELNSFFPRFGIHDFSEACSEVMAAIRNRTDERIIISEERARQSLGRGRAGKATGPDGAPAKALKRYAGQLAPMPRQLFRASIDQGVVPVQWKVSEIKPIAKVSSPRLLNDFRPVVFNLQCHEMSGRYFECL